MPEAQSSKHKPQATSYKLQAKSRRLLLFLLFATLAAGADKRVISPPGVKPVGPYSPGILVGDYLSVSGQGPHDASGAMPDTFEGRVQQTLDNVKSIVENAGLTMEHVVYSQVYLADVANYDALNRVWSKNFPTNPPARAVLGVASLPTGIAVEINAVAIKDLADKKSLSSGAVLTKDRVFIPGVLGMDPQTGKVPDDPAEQVQLAFEQMKHTLESAGIDFAHLVFVNPYLTSEMPMNVMNHIYAQHFEFGNTPARATIHVAALPLGAHIEYTGVAVRDLSQRRAVRPKNMSPSPTASPCVFAGDTLYCSAKSGFIPGPNLGIYAETVENQVRQSMRNLLDGLEEDGMDLSNAVASNVYLNDMSEFANMNGIYALYFKDAPPTRTTVQPHAPVERKADEKGRWPNFVEISLIAVK